jgi:hypothetical protein
MKILVTEEQVRLLMREFGETVSDWDTWLAGIYDWTNNPQFDHSIHEVIAFGEDGEYLGYWDSDQNSGFVVTELVDDEMEETISPEDLQDIESFHGDNLRLSDLIDKDEI